MRAGREVVMSSSSRVSSEQEENVASAKNFSDVLNRLQSEQSTLEAQMTQKRSQLVRCVASLLVLSANSLH
jgi:septum formation inhibitor-activating ATPase MinD